MIPNKLYIPTSTLNFNNIMSSESISPAGFYSVRGFGYKRFEKTELNNLDNRIILYDKYPIFNINDKELENYPMIIEIDTKTINDDIIQKYKEGVYYSEETIYLNPFTTKFFFSNEAEKRSTLSKAEPSIETKMVSLYQYCFAIQPAKGERLNRADADIKDSKNYNPNNIAKDRKINKLKGLLYVYILAANKSFPAQVVTLKKYTKDLRNTLSAIITSPDGRATNKQQEQLNSIYNAINDTFCKAEGFNKMLQEIVEKYFKKDRFEEFIERFGKSWLPKPTFQLSPFFVSNTANIDEKEKTLELYILNLERAINRFTKPKLIQREQLPALQHCTRIDSIPEQKGFVSKLLNEYLEEAYNSKEFIQSRYEFAKSGGKIFKEEIQKDWEGSEYQMYINTLLRNLNEYSSFDIKSTDNLTLKSFAAFCQKGDADIDKLEDYLVSNEIGDFRIAFSLWGIIFGFANMPKTLTNDLFLSDRLDYTSEIYKYIFNQVHGIELNGTFERKQEAEIVTFPSKINERLIEDRIIKNPKINLLEQELSNFEEFTSRDNAIQKEIITKLNESEIYSLADWNDKKIDSIKWSASKGQKKLMTVIAKSRNNAKAKKQPIQQQETTLFVSLPEKDFYKDTNVGSLIENLLPNDKKIKKLFKEDLDWFQDEFKKGDLSSYYGKSNRDNSSVIEAFNRYIAKKKYANKVSIPQIIFKLKELYL